MWRGSLRGVTVILRVVMIVLSVGRREGPVTIGVIVVINSGTRFVVVDCCATPILEKGSASTILDDRCKVDCRW